MPGNWVLVFFCPEKNNDTLEWQKSELLFYSDELSRRGVIWYVEGDSAVNQYIIPSEILEKLKIEQSLKSNRYYTLLLNEKDIVLYLAQKAVTMEDILLIIDIAKENQKP